MKIFSKIYDIMLYLYLYASNWFVYQTDRYIEFRENVRWIKENPNIHL